jgi:hypothetical protein
LIEAELALMCDTESELDPELILGWRPAGYVEGLLGDEQAPERIATILKDYLEKA